MCLSDRQVKHKKLESTRMTAEMPQQLAIGLTVHQAVRRKELISLLHGGGGGRGTCLPAPLLRGVRDIVKGRHVFFAIDNVDFTEDTADGKRTFHGTAMAIY